MSGGEAITATGKYFLDILGIASAFNFLPPCHTSGGVEGTVKGVLDIGTISRYLKEKENVPSIEEYFFCRDALVFFTNRNVSIKDISKGQLIDIYRGKTRNWKELGAEEGKIFVLGRPEHSSAYLAVTDLLFIGSNVRFLPEMIVIEHAGDSIPAVIDAEDSIGYTSLGRLLAERPPVQILSIDGHYPSVENIRSGTYPFFRPIGIVCRKNVSNTIASFVEYLYEEEAKAFLRERGYIPES